MKKPVHIVRRRVLPVALLIGIAAAGLVRAQQDPEAEFKKLADAFTAAWSKGDAKAIAALHTKGAVRVTGNGEPAVIGTAAIEKDLTGALTGEFKGTQLVITPNKSHRVTADVYIGEGTYQITGGTPPAGTPTNGQYMNTMVRQGGRWLIAASAVMPAMPRK